MSVSKLELELPFSFVPDPILYTATPEQRAIVLTTGCVALKALLNKTFSLSNEEAYKKATADQTALWLAEKSHLEITAEQEKKELLDQKAAEVKQLNDKLAAEQNKIKRKEEELIKAETLRQSESDTIIRERDRTRAQVESEKSNEIQKLNKEVDAQKLKIETFEKALRDAEKRVADIAIQAEKNKSKEIEKVREQLNKKLEEQQDRLLSLTGRQSNSSLKGQDNEKTFAQNLHSVFGLTPDYLVMEHRINSGDHIIQWEGLKLMFENKDYKETVTTKEEEKAVNDFVKHSECDVLIFVSERSSIANHQRPGHLDINTVDGRAAIWIGNFNHNENKVVYLQMIAQVIRQLVLLQKRARDLGNGDDVIGDYKNKISSIRRYLQFSKEDLDKLVKAQNEYQRMQKLSWDALKEQITTFKSNFSRRLANAMKDDDDEMVDNKENEESLTNDEIIDTMRQQHATVDDDSEPETKKCRTSTSNKNKNKPKAKISPGSSTSITKFFPKK